MLESIPVLPRYIPKNYTERMEEGSMGDPPQDPLDLSKKIATPVKADPTGSQAAEYRSHPATGSRFSPDEPRFSPQESRFSRGEFGYPRDDQGFQKEEHQYPGDESFSQEEGRVSQNSPELVTSQSTGVVKPPSSSNPVYNMDLDHNVELPSTNDSAFIKNGDVHSSNNYARNSPEKTVASSTRPFKMYSSNMDPRIYHSPLMSGSSSPIAQLPLQTLPGLISLPFDATPSSSPGSSAFGVGGPMPTMLSMSNYISQKRRRAEARDKDKEKEAIPATVTSGAAQSTEEGGETDSKKAKTVPEERKDDAYWERRRKNNEAAKRSRDARRQKEEEIAMRAAFLEQENLKLRAQIAVLKNETAKLHYLLYNRV